MGAAMGIGRFAYTPILPLMTAQAAITPQMAGQLATANYVGYLAGALAGTAWTGLTRSAVVWRASLIVLVTTLAAMPFGHNVIGWATLRAVAGFASALVFVIAVNSMMDNLSSHAPHLPGWGFGGVGVGIALSGGLALAMPTSDWHAAWWISAVAAAVLSAFAWRMIGTAHVTTESERDGQSPRIRLDRDFSILLLSYTLEGIGYIVAGTFLVAAIRQTSSGWLGNGAWLMVGIAAAPSAALWAWLASRWSHPRLLVVALALQAVGIAIPALAHGAAPALAGAVLFGGTFIGVSTIALAAGRRLGLPGAVALLTAGYSAGQIVGPVAVTPLLQHGFRLALVAAALVVAAAAVAAALVRIPSASVSPVRVVEGQPC